MNFSRFKPTCAILLCATTLIITPTHAQTHEQAPYITLKNVLSRVYKTNPELNAARVELQEVNELYPQARAGWLPSINGETSIFATDVDNSNFGGADGATTKNLTLSIDQPIWRGGRTFAETARARDLIRAGQAFLQQQEQDIFLETATIYMDVLRDQELLDLRLQNEDILLKELQAAWERMDIGDITDTDVQQAKSRLSRAKSERIAAEGNLDISKARFKQIVGVDSGDNLRIPYIDFDFPETINQMIEKAEKLNPEILIAKYEESAAKHGADATFRELFPQVSAFASYNKQYDPQPGIIDESATETIGIRATLALYEGGATRSRSRQAQRAIRRRAYEVNAIKRRIAQEVTSNHRSLISAAAQTQNRAEEIEAADKALFGVREEARIGQRSILDILDADADLINAKVALANARRNEAVAKFSLATSLSLFKPSMLETMDAE